MLLDTTWTKTKLLLASWWMPTKKTALYSSLFPRKILQPNQDNRFHNLMQVKNSARESTSNKIWHRRNSVDLEIKRSTLKNMKNWTTQRLTITLKSITKAKYSLWETFWSKKTENSNIISKSFSPKMMIWTQWAQKCLPSYKEKTSKRICTFVK